MITKFCKDVIYCFVNDNNSGQHYDNSSVCFAFNIRLIKNGTKI